MNENEKNTTSFLSSRYLFTDSEGWKVMRTIKLHNTRIHSVSDAEAAVLVEFVHDAFAVLVGTEDLLLASPASSSDI